MAETTYQFFALIEKTSAREVYGRKLVELAIQDDRVIVMTADLMRTNRTGEFLKAHPDRFFNTGIAEQDMMGIAAGLALEGKIPFVSTMATFASMRACEQVRTDICYPNLNVRIVGTHCGLTTGAGPTHYGQEDIAIMRSFPNMTVVVPGDPNQIGKVIESSMKHKGPLYVRIGRGGEPVVYTKDYEYIIGKSIRVREGGALTIIACGIGISNSLEAANKLADEGIEVRVIDMHTIKPIDREAVICAAEDTGIIITVEDHNIVGGLGSAVADVIAEESLGCRFKKLGIPDTFGVIGQPEELYHKYGYDSDGIYKAVKATLRIS